MNKEALEHVQNDAVGLQVLADTNNRAVALPDDYDIRSLETFFDKPFRFRGRVTTDSMADFIKYANDTKQDSSALFINKNDMSADFIVDFGTDQEPRHGEHKATLELVASPAGKALFDANGKKFSQQELCEWLEDWRSHITVTDESGENMTIAQATASIRRINITASSNNEFEDNESSKKLSRSEQIEAKMKGQQPSNLQFTCTPYADIEPVTFEVKINVIVGDRPIIRLRVVQFETIKENIAQEFKQKLVDEISGIRAYIGNFTK